jgi:PAS domain S-box-containing protein
MNATPLNLLLVEDQPADVDMLQRMLRRGSGFRVRHTASLAGALEILTQKGTDVILLDLTLPDSHGLETLDRVAAGAPELPIIVVTHLDDEETAVGAVRAGAQEYVVKGRIDERQLDHVIWSAVERKRVEEQLRTLSRAVDQSPVSIVITDTQGRVEYVNPRFCQSSGYAQAEVLGMNLRMLKSGSTPAEVYRDLWATISVGKEWRGELCNRKKSGELYWESVSISPVRGTSGAVTHFVGFKEDITVRKQLEEQILRSQRMESVSTALGGIAHSFNNLLNNVLGFALLLKKYSDDQAKIRKYTDAIEQSVARGATLAQRLIAVSQDEQPTEVAVDLSTVVREACDRLLLPPGQQVRLSVDLPADLHDIGGDPAAIGQAIVNVLTNAVEAIADAGTPGEIRVTGHNVMVEGAALPIPAAMRDRPWVCVQVTDSGPGITPEVRDRMFEPFFTTRNRGQGGGLGLSVVYNIVRRHRGLVTVDSAPGSGTTFEFFFPARIAEAESASPLTARRNEQVLLVDDEPAMREFGRELLQEFGYRVLLASDGEEAVALYREHHAEIDLVVLDLLMPRMDGAQTYLELKSIRPDLKAFFCTGFAADQVITSLLEEEKLKAVKKPFQVNDFLRAVRDVLDGR